MASPRANKSEAWKHFEKVDEGKVRCKLCKDELKYSGGSTSVMINHIRHRHAASTSLTPEKSGKQSGLAAFGFSPRHSMCNTRQEKITEQLANALVANMLPISLVE